MEKRMASRKKGSCTRSTQLCSDTPLYRLAKASIGAIASPMRT